MRPSLIGLSHGCFDNRFQFDFSKRIQPQECEDFYELRRWSLTRVSSVIEMGKTTSQPTGLVSTWRDSHGIGTSSVWQIGSHLANVCRKSPAWIVDTFDISEGQPYPILFCAITLTWYSLLGLRWVNTHDWVDWETFFDVHDPSELAAFICARYPVSIPPSASREGGLQVKFIELQPLFKSKRVTLYGTSMKSESSFSINKQK